MEKLKISIIQRGKALVLLSRGKKIDETVEILQKRYHPTKSKESVKKTYFPAKSFAAISKYEGKGRDEISQKFSEIVRNSKKKREWLSSLHKDEDFATRRDLRAIEQITRLNKDL
ncbi:MAG: hypothetical protein AABY04_02470, partial [Candidatus Micrarchaeota archaeon]